jgi:hypothetical protein
MSACKQYQRQLALLSVQALDQSEAADALAHTELCPGCREYWVRLQKVACLYRDDAERTVAATTREQVIVRSRPKQEFFTWRHVAALGMAALVMCATVFLLRQDRPQPTKEVPVASQSRPVSVLSIADSRRLLNKDLEAAPDTPEHGSRSEYVYSVASRHEDL